MPSQKFFNLDISKQTAILNAVRDEFLETSYSELKISRVIQRAGISRASFYLYFRDKEDLFCCMLFRMGEDIVRGLANIFEEERGNFFNSMRTLALRLLEDDAGLTCRRLYRHILADETCKGLALQVEKKLYRGELGKSCSQRCYELLDRNLYPQLDEAQFACAMDMGVMIVSQTLSMEAGGGQAGELLKTVARQLDILEKGIRV